MTPFESARRRPSPPAILLILALSIGLAGCGEKLFDEVDVYSAHEYVTRADKAEELLWAYKRAGIHSVAVAAGALEAPPEPDRPEPDPPEYQNDLLLEASKSAPGKAVPFIYIPYDIEDPLAFFVERQREGARGLALWQRGGPDEIRLTDPRYEPLYQYLELHGIPCFAHIETDVARDELVALLTDHPELHVIAGGMMGLPSDLDAVSRYLEMIPNLFVDIGFDAIPELPEIFNAIAGDRERAALFFELMQDRVLFAAGLNFDHRLHRRGQWGAQLYTAYRLFVERDSVQTRIRAPTGKWTPVEYAGLALENDKLAKLYHHNFRRIVGQKLPETGPGNLHLLKSDVVSGWSFDPVSANLLVVALVAPKGRLVQTISTQRLRDALAGKLTDWKELNGEPGPVRIGSFGGFAKFIADRLEAPLVATVVEFDTPEELLDALVNEGDLLGFVPLARLDGRVEVLTVDGDNPCVSNVRFCASKGSPTVRNYFPTYPLLIPIAYPEDAPAPVFDPYQLRTFLIAGGLSAPDEPFTLDLDRSEADDAFARRMRPVYDLHPNVRRSDFPIFLSAKPNEREAFLLRVLGARSLVPDGGAVRAFGSALGEAQATLRSTVRGMPVTIATGAADLGGAGVEVLALPASATRADIDAGLAAGADAVLAGNVVRALRRLGSTNIPLGDFLGDEGSNGAFLTLTFLGDRLAMARVTPIETKEGMVQRRYGDEARALALAAWQ